MRFLVLPEDLQQIGLPEHAENQVREILRDTPFFTEEQHVYKVAVAVALAKGWQKDESWFRSGNDQNFATKWRAVLLDHDRTMKRFIELFAPESQGAPYRYSQHLALAGVNYLHQELVQKDKSIVDVLQLTHS